MRRSLAAILSLTALPATALPALADPGRVIADLPPAGALLREVVGDLGEVQILLQGGGDAHDYQMRPSDARSLQDAALLVWVGPEMTRWLERPAETVAGEVPQLRLLEIEGTELQDYAGEGGHDHAHDDHSGEHDDDHDHEDPDHGQDHAGHGHSDIDPHAWLNPANAGPWMTAMAESLAGIDPENAETYRNNATEAAARIEATTEALRERLAPHANKDFVVFHDAYGYFTTAFGLKPATAIALGDASTPSAQRLDDIRGQVAESGATCAFPEYAHDGRLIETVIEGTDTRMGEALSPEGGHLGEVSYEQLLTAMAETMIACFESAES